MNTSSALTQASQQAFAKLHPKLAFKNPVMLVVWVATLIAVVITVQQLGTGDSFGFALASSVILFFTLWFANFAEAIAEARGRDQAASLKATRRDLTAVKLDSVGERRISASELKAGDKILVQAGELIPADGEIVIGVATINESALTGESAPVLREAGTDHSGVIAGTKVLSGTITVRVTAESGHSFLDKMISLVEGTNRQKTPNELALTVLLSALTLVFLIAVATLPAMASFVDIELDWLMLIALVVCLIPTTIAGLLPAIGIAGMNRALAANVIAKSGKAVEVAGDIDTLLLDKTGTITFGDRQATAFLPLPGVPQADLIKAALWCSLQDPTPEGKSVVRLANELEYASPALHDDDAFTPFSAETRLSSINLVSGEQYVKGAADAVKSWAQSRGLAIPTALEQIVTRIAQQGATPLVVASQQRVLGGSPRYR